MHSSPPWARMVIKSENDLHNDYTQQWQVFFIYIFPGHVCDQMEYILITKMMSQKEALSYCRQHYTDLLSFTNQNGFLGIKREILKTTKLCWIGLRRTSKKDPWLWENGETLYYTNWIRGEPRDKLCAVLDVHGIYLNKWKTEDCGSKKNFICYKGNYYSQHS